MKITTNQYAKSLYELTADKPQSDIDGIVARFIKVLQKSRKMKLANKIIAKFSEIYNQKNGIVEAEVATARKLDQATINMVKDFIQKKYNAREVVLSAKGGSASGGNNKIDLNIKGGIVIKVGDEIMDGSVVRQLENLKSILAK